MSDVAWSPDSVRQSEQQDVNGCAKCGYDLILVHNLVQYSVTEAMQSGQGTLVKNSLDNVFY